MEPLVYLIDALTSAGEEKEEAEAASAEDGITAAVRTMLAHIGVLCSPHFVLYFAHIMRTVARRMDQKATIDIAVHAFFCGEIARKMILFARQEPLFLTKSVLGCALPIGASIEYFATELVHVVRIQALKQSILFELTPILLEFAIEVDFEMRYTFHALGVRYVPFSARTYAQVVSNLCSAIARRGEEPMHLKRTVQPLAKSWSDFYVRRLLGKSKKIMNAAGAHRLTTEHVLRAYEDMDV